MASMNSRNISMSLLIKLRNALAEPRLHNVDVESGDLLTVHLQILSEKPMLQGVFYDFYRLCRKIDEKYFSGEGKRMEIGAGVSLIKRYYPDVIVTDIKPACHLDMILDAQKMNLPDSSVRGIYGINCFHHLTDPDHFFRELQRVLIPGGGGILIDPYYGILAKAFYRRAFDTEHFNKNQVEWRSWDGTMGVMKGANQALSYIVFHRDVHLFHTKHPGLEIVFLQRLGNYLRYFLSGGLNFRQLVPSFITPVIKLIEFVLIPVGHFMALHHVIVLRKKPGYKV